MTAPAADLTTAGGARRLAGTLLAAAGVPVRNACRTAAVLVAADVWGVASHGLLRLPHYLERLVAGGCRAGAVLDVVTDTGPLVAFDGNDGLGHWQLWAAAERARDRARRYGVAAVTVGRSSHCGALGAYVYPVVDAGLVALVLSNGPAVMPPWQGRRPVVSTSPVAVGFPAGDHPAVVDLATSAVARGRIAARAAAGEPLPAGWALTADGQPTVDAAEALRGMLAPLGGAKGFALALAVEALTGGLVGPALSTQVADMLDPADAARPQRIAHTVLALDPGRAGVDDRAGERLAGLAGDVRAAGGRVPGQAREAPDRIPDSQPLVLPSRLCAQLRRWTERLVGG